MVFTSFVGYLMVFTGKVLSQELEEVYPISDFDQRVETGYFNGGGRYLGGIPRLKTTTTYAVCGEFSTGNATSLSDICTEWMIFEEGEKRSECVCSDATCGQWTCTEYYTGDINNRCECIFSNDDRDDSNNTCASWGCGGSQVETVQRSRNGKTKDLIVSRGSFKDLDGSSWNGVISSSTRYSQEFCRRDVSESILWECTRKTYRNCSTRDNVWCSLDMSLVLVFFPFLIFSVGMILSYYYSVFFSFVFLVALILTVFGIVVSGGMYGIYVAMVVAGLVCVGFSVIFCRKRIVTQQVTTCNVNL